MKPVQHSLIFCFGSFDDDTVGYETDSQVVVSVGDFIEHRRSPKMAPSVEPGPNETFQVTAVKHAFVESETHVSHYTQAALSIVAKSH